MKIKVNQIYYDTTLDFIWLVASNVSDVFSLYEIDCGDYITFSDGDGYDDFIYIGEL